ncbi:MAG: hypothetical protein ACTHKF_05435 [Candidatus Nitrosocosmicus sp.]
MALPIFENIRFSFNEYTAKRNRDSEDVRKIKILDKNVKSGLFVPLHENQ